MNSKAGISGRSEEGKDRVVRDQFELTVEGPKHGLTFE